MAEEPTGKYFYNVQNQNHRIICSFFFVAKNRVYVSCFEVEGKKVAIKSFFFYGAFAKWPIFLHFEKFGNSEVGT
jgi:hypothetical protein